MNSQTIDRYDLAVVKNDLELKINNLTDRYKKSCTTSYNEIRRLDKMISGGLDASEDKFRTRFEAMHVNIMLLNDDIDKMNDIICNNKKTITYLAGFNCILIFSVLCSLVL